MTQCQQSTVELWSKLIALMCLNPIIEEYWSFIHGHIFKLGEKQNFQDKQVGEGE